MVTAQTATRTVQVGDFFVESWGYDQTNIDFYQVVKVSTSGQTVWIRHVQSALVSEDGSGSTHVAPVPDGFDTAYTASRQGVLRKRLRRYDTGNGAYYSVNLTSYSSASLWDGTPAYQTASGWGH